MKPLYVLESYRILRMTRAGALQPWLGPALRGLVAKRWKDRVCAWPDEERARWKYCKGCPKMAGCPYGEVVEPDPPRDRHIAMGMEDASRPLVLDAAFPLPPRSREGFTFPLRVVFIGEKAAGHAQGFWEMVQEVGNLKHGGLGSDGIGFDVLPWPDSEAEQISEIALPLTTADSPGWLPWIRLKVLRPLILQSTDPKGRKSLVTAPNFSDLTRAALRTLGGLFRLFAEPIPDEVFKPFKELTDHVATLQARFQPFVQGKRSNRTHQNWQAEGILGEAIYGPVPAVLIPWLMWSGLLHVGKHRVAGAGGWEIAVADG